MEGKTVGLVVEEDGDGILFIVRTVRAAETEMAYSSARRQSLKEAATSDGSEVAGPGV